MNETRVRNRIGAGSEVAEQSKALSAAIATIGVGGGAIVGLWSVSCFVGGMIASGGPIAFVASWFKAVFGL
ncbi:MAG: hypothetical protein KKD73_09850 [Proteobacteria bacterium]|nr:hypothetical protein [Pseudomonadota bacterium]MBU1638896.1 hypothetical protein [Pseudomonadota bacterium]